MPIQSVCLTIEPDQAYAQAYRILRSFEPSLELGPTLKSMRSGERIVSLDHVRQPNLERFVRLIDGLAMNDVEYSVWISPVPVHRNKDDTKTRQGSRQDLVAELNQLTAIELSLEAYRAFREKHGYDDGHSAIAQREHEYDAVLQKLWQRSASIEFAELLCEEANYLYLAEFELHLFRGGFREYFACPAGDSAADVESSLSDIGSTEILALLRDSMLIFDPAGGYSRNSSERVERLSQIDVSAFDDMNERFCNRSEDAVTAALEQVSDAYEADNRERVG